jgi:glycerate kinase
MKVVIAPDSFKGSLSGFEVCDIVERGILQVFPAAEITKVPISDGGEGLVRLLLTALTGESVKIKVHDPLFRIIEAEYGIIKGDTAVIEMAAASGLPLLKKNEQNPLLTNSYGTGEMIVDAVKAKGCRKILLGIGGSATNDGGMGMATALGIRFLDENHQELEPCGRNLSKIETIDLSDVDSAFSEVEFIIACDVDNPLCGHQGAAHIYAPQKGANEDMVVQLDNGLEHLGRLFEALAGSELIDRKGIGAAGGLALPLVALYQASLKSGLEIVLDAIKFDKLITGADLIVTGEGKTDHQSAMGKVISGIGRRGKNQQIPVVVVSGALEKGYESLFEHGVTAAFASYSNAKSLAWHMENAEQLLYDTIVNIFRLFSISGWKAQ